MITVYYIGRNSGYKDIDIVSNMAYQMLWYWWWDDEIFDNRWNDGVDYVYQKAHNV